MAFFLDSAQIILPCVAGRRSPAISDTSVGSAKSLAFAA